MSRGPTQESLSRLTLEQVVTGHGYADLDASPLQRAICRAAQGRPVDDLLDSDTTERHFGVRSLSLRTEDLSSGMRAGLLPTLIVLVCGVRSGKSFLAACAAIWACLTADLSPLKQHEVPRFAIVGPTTDAARATFVLLCGILRNSRVLKRFVDGEPTSDTVVIKRPDGRRVEIVVVAAARGGLSVRNRWLVGYVFEEVAQFGTVEAGAVINAEELRRAAETRLLPGCIGWEISSPYGPQGELYQQWEKNYGKPGRTLVVWADTRSMNPSFPKEQIDAIAAEDPDTAGREYGALWLDAESAYYAAVNVDAARRLGPMYRHGHALSAACDPATRGNSWTLACAWSETIRPANWYYPPHERDPDRHRVIVAGVWSWQGSKAAPLSPRQVFKEIAAALRPYGCRRIYTDSWSFDAMRDHAEAAGLLLVEHPSVDRELPYQRLDALLRNNDVELPPDPQLRADLIAVRKRAVAGGVKAHLPTTANGRHCDTVPAVALAVRYAERLQHGPNPVGVYIDSNGRCHTRKPAHWD